jgi:membrane protease YdiL (CAAX protease family)
MNLGESNSFPKLSIASSIVFILYIIFTVIHSLEIDEPIKSVLFFVPGLLGVSLLVFTSGLKLSDLFLRVAPISKAGLFSLAIFTPFLAPILLTGGYIGWNWISVLIYAPASGISQELFFRATLLPVFIKVFGGRPLLAIVLHSVLFAAWHLPPILMTNSSGVLPITLVTFLGGLAWGWQIYKDKTVIWAMAHHSLFLMAMALFEWV